MKILQVCHKPPYPNVDGGTFAEQALTRLLVQSKHQVDLLTLSTEKHPFKFDHFPDWLIKQGEIFNVNLKTLPSKTGATKNLINQQSYITSRFRQEEFKNTLKEKLKNNYALVIFDGLVSAIYLPELKNDFSFKTVLRSHNLEFLVWDNLSQKVSNLIKKKYYKVQSKRLKKEETKIFNSVDAIWHLNKEEIPLFPKEVKHKLDYIPVCINKFGLKPVVEKQSFAVGFIGAMNWQPNFEAALFIANEIAPELKKQNINTIIAGRYQKEDLLNSSNLINLGEVEKANTFFDKIDVFLNPVYSGSGIRIKILDAINHQKPIVSTAKGIEGWGLKADKHFLLAETKEAFISQVNRLKLNKDLANTLSQNCVFHFKNEFSFETSQEILNQNLKKIF